MLDGKHLATIYYEMYQPIQDAGPNLIVSNQMLTVTYPKKVEGYMLRTVNGQVELHSKNGVKTIDLYCMKGV